MPNGWLCAGWLTLSRRLLPLNRSPEKQSLTSLVPPRVTNMPLHALFSSLKLEYHLYMLPQIHNDCITFCIFTKSGMEGFLLVLLAFRRQASSAYRSNTVKTESWCASLSRTCVSSASTEVRCVLTSFLSFVSHNESLTCQERCLWLFVETFFGWFSVRWCHVALHVVLPCSCMSCQLLIPITKLSRGTTAKPDTLSLQGPRRLHSDVDALLGLESIIWSTLNPKPIICCFIFLLDSTVNLFRLGHGEEATDHGLCRTAWEVEHERHMGVSEN